jgi:hypothetical protein
LTVFNAQAADITVSSRFSGGTIFHIDGFINVGDERGFTRIASQYFAQRFLGNPQRLCSKLSCLALSIACDLRLPIS